MDNLWDEIKPINKAKALELYNFLNGKLANEKPGNMTKIIFTPNQLKIEFSGLDEENQFTVIKKEFNFTLEELYPDAPKPGPECDMKEELR